MSCHRRRIVENGRIRRDNIKKADRSHIFVNKREDQVVLESQAISTEKENETQKYLECHPHIE